MMDMEEKRSKQFANDTMKSTVEIVDENIKIGLEIHCQLTNLNTKLFCGCISNYRNIKPNENICPICLGLPGSLPLLNKKAVEYATMICISLDCNLPERILFYRKNYFYPDLPKNFQITQYNSYELSSIGYDGNLSYSEKESISKDKNVMEKRVRIKRVQLEEDPGKIVYEDDKAKLNNYCLIDYNRAGVALVEIVTEPDFNNPADVRFFLNKITNIFEYLGVLDPNLEGSVRCDVNVSIKGGKKVEIKNISSFKDVERSIFYEITRQKTLSIHEIKIKSETRHWDEKRKITFAARTKEEEEEYKYFPEPDIPSIFLGNCFKDKIKEMMPELPNERLNRYKNEHNLSDHISNILVNNKRVSDFYEEALKLYNSPKEISNWIINELMSKINEDEVEKMYTNSSNGSKENKFFNLSVTPQQIADMAKLVKENSVNRNIAKEIFDKSIKTGKSPLTLIQNINATKISDQQTLINYINDVLNKENHLKEQSTVNPNIHNFILGKIMKITSGRADPKITLTLIKKVIDESI